MNERTTVRLPDTLLRRARRKAAAEGTTLTALIDEGLRRVLNEGNGAKKASRRLPRTSVATGGLRQGVDLNDMSAIQELDDLEHVGRTR